MLEPNLIIEPSLYILVGIVTLTFVGNILLRFEQLSIAHFLYRRLIFSG